VGLSATAALDAMAAAAKALVRFRAMNMMFSRSSMLLVAG
jgi:hypothetical protein